MRAAIMNMARTALFTCARPSDASSISFPAAARFERR
jgi:hypothetical protein